MEEMAKHPPNRIEDQRAAVVRLRGKAEHTLDEALDEDHSTEERDSFERVADGYRRLARDTERGIEEELAANKGEN